MITEIYNSSRIKDKLGSVKNLPATATCTLVGKWYRPTAIMTICPLHSNQSRTGQVQDTLHSHSLLLLCTLKDNSKGVAAAVGEACPIACGVGYQ
ncbi:MAG TPA: hypothetical protein V6D11_31475 [Waterburya sp.]